MTLTERYEALKAKVTDRKDEFAKLMEFVEKETAYLTTPASTRFHLCREQGLLEHSVNVAETIRSRSQGMRFLKVSNTEVRR